MGADNYVDPQKKATALAVAGVPASTGFSSVSPTAPTPAATTPAIDFSTGQGRIAVQPTWHPSTGFGQGTTPGFWEHPANEISTPSYGQQDNGPQYSGYRGATLSDLQNAGLWSNVGSFTDSPLWQAHAAGGNTSLFGTDLATNPGKQAIALLTAAGLGLQSKPEDFQRAFAGQNITPEQIQQMQGHLTAQQQDAASSHWEDYVAPMAFDAALAMVLGPAAMELGISPAVLQGGLGMLSGQAPGQIAKSLAVGQGINAGADFAAPAVNDFANSFQNANPSDENYLSGIKRNRGVQLADAGISTTDVSPGMLDWGNAMDAHDAAEGAAMLRNAAGGVGSSLTNTLEQQDADQGAAMKQLQQQQPAITGKDVQQYAKTAQTVYRLLGQSAPQGPVGQSPAQQQQYFAQSLGLDPKSVDAAGPLGSPQAMAYILAQANDIIGQLGFSDPAFLDRATPEQLQQAFADKSADEVNQLARALYVRGQLSGQSFSDKAVDPFSGQTEDVSGAQGSPDVAAFQRGKAADVQQLGNMQGTQARGFFDQLLGRQRDLYGMQGTADANLLKAQIDDQSQLAQTGKKRTSTDYMSALENMSPEQLTRLLQAFGPERGRAALTSLMNSDSSDISYF